MTEEELREILAETEAASNAWMQGEWERGFGALVTERDDACILGPFGGSALEGRAWNEAAKRGVKQFANGQAKLELVQSYAADDLLVLVLHEEQQGDLAGIENQPWSLRVTQVYRREEGRWRIVHRHADPLVQRRTLEETAALVRTGTP
jgi:ketosteroid isomerase-like protein